MDNRLCIDLRPRIHLINSGFWFWVVTLLPSHGPPRPTRPTPNQAPPKSQTPADVRSFLVIFDRFRPILVKNGQNRLEIGSSKGGLLNVSAVWGEGSVAGSQVTSFGFLIAHLDLNSALICAFKLCFSSKVRSRSLNGFKETGA